MLTLVGEISRNTDDRYYYCYYCYNQYYSSIKILTYSFLPFVFRHAFKRFYQEYMAFTHPTEDIWIE